MKMKYDGVSDVLDILLSDKQIHDARDYGSVIINFDEQHQIVEIEILNASEFFGKLITGMIQSKQKDKSIAIEM